MKNVVGFIAFHIKGLVMISSTKVEPIQIGMDSFHYKMFLQMQFHMYPHHLLQDLVGGFPNATTTQIALDRKSMPGQLWEIDIGGKKVKTILALYLSGEEEPWSNVVNRFNMTGETFMFLNLGPESRTYCTPRQNFVVKPGDLITVGPQTRAFYGLSLLEAVFLEKVDDSKTKNLALFFEMQ
jgi:hypothetical protein